MLLVLVDAPLCSVVVLCLSSSSCISWGGHAFTALFLQGAGDSIEGVYRLGKGGEIFVCDTSFGHGEADVFEADNVAFAVFWFGASEYMFVKCEDYTEGVEGYEAK